MRGRSYSYSPSTPRHYHRRGRSPSPRGRYGGHGGRDMPTSLLVRNLRHGCKMRGRGYSYSPSTPRHYHRRGRSPCLRGRYGGDGDRDMPTSLLVRNLRHGCKMRGRSYSYSPSPPRHYHRRGRIPSPRGRYGGCCGRDMPTSLLVRNLRHGCKEPRGFGFVQYVDPTDVVEAKYQTDKENPFCHQSTVIFAEESRKKPADTRAIKRMSRYNRRLPRPSRSLTSIPQDILVRHHHTAADLPREATITIHLHQGNVAILRAILQGRITIRFSSNEVKLLIFSKAARLLEVGIPWRLKGP